MFCYKYLLVLSIQNQANKLSRPCAIDCSGSVWCLLDAGRLHEERRFSAILRSVVWNRHALWSVGAVPSMLCSAHLPSWQVQHCGVIPWSSTTVRYFRLQVLHSAQFSSLITLFCHLFKVNVVIFIAASAIVLSWGHRLGLSTDTRHLYHHHQHRYRIYELFASHLRRHRHGSTVFSLEYHQSTQTHSLRSFDPQLGM